ncbi:MAG: SIS domain-containing protein [Thermotogota bacterium]|nr:SIS domain-containing protein [Thermotogota bacterium]
MKTKNKYLESIKNVLDEVEQNEKGNIEKAAQLIYESARNDKHVYIFGCTHSSILAEEVYYRAGSLALFEPIFAPGLSVTTTKPRLTSYVERNEQYGKDIVESSRINEGDCIIVISTSGRNAVPVTVALESKKRGAKVITLTSKNYEKFDSKHSTGKKLSDEIFDVVINNHVPEGDSVIPVNGVTMGPVSTYAGAFVLHSISMRVAEKYLENGEQPDILVSSNIPEGEQMNKELFDKERVRDMYLLP